MLQIQASQSQISLDLVSLDNNVLAFSDNENDVGRKGTEI